MTRQRAAIRNGQYVSWYEECGPSRAVRRESSTTQGAILGKMMQKHPAAEVAKRPGERDRSGLVRC